MSVQLCPKCSGQGTVSKPPWIPGDVHTWNSGTLAPYVCNLCDGRKVIDVEAAALTGPTDGRESRPCPKCGQMCHYDGWGLVHASGLGIGSCVASTGPEPRTDAAVGR